MEEFINNYISWDFDREYSKKQKIRRFKDLEKYIFHLFKKMTCILIKRRQWEEIVNKYYILLFEYRDLAWNLKDVDMEEELNLLEEKILKIKEESGYCLKCFGEGGENIEFCVCEECDDCGRIELCFCD